MGSGLLVLFVLRILFGRCAHLLEGAGAGPSTPSTSTSAEPPTRPPGPWDHWRLPAALAPLHYSLLLWPHLAPGLPEPRTHSGRVSITVRCRQDTATVLLHSAHLTYQSAAVWGPGANGSSRGSRRRRIPVAELWEAPSNQYVVLELREKLSAGALYELQLAFCGRIHTDPHFVGLFLNTYRDEGESRWLIASQLQAAAARTVYPCFDEPAMKATFNISIVHHPSYVALSNMPAIEVSEYKDVNESTLNGLMNGTTPINWTVTTFETTPKMSTYLSAFVVCNFDHVTRTERGKEIRIWAKKNVIQKGLVDYALNISGPIFSFMEDLLNISYTLPKADLIALPDMRYAAMENWGLITFNEFYLFSPPQDKSTEWKTMIYQLVSHEIVHQWFGNLVTMVWWNDMWLNEGFASYFSLYLEPTVPLEQAFGSVVLDMLRMEEQMQHPTLSYAEEKHQQPTFPDLSVAYKKGTAILWMLSSFMTEKLFIKALNSYLNAFSFSNVIQDDLWNHMQKVIDEQNDIQLPASVKVIMDTWTCQSGFPLLTVNFSTGLLSQEKMYSKEGNNNANNTWIIPISWIRNGTIQPLVWLDNRSKIFPEMKISDSEYDWIILNVNMTGYYKINYDQMYWRRLAEVLEHDPKVIPVVNRLQLITDAFQLSESNDTEYDTPLYLTKYLEKEDDVLVWQEALKRLKVDNWELIVNDYELYSVLKKYFLPRISPIYHYNAYLLRQSFDVLAAHHSNEYEIETIFQTACWLGLRDCLDLASEIFTKWMNNSSPQTPFCLSKSICCYGIQLGSDKEWNFAWKMFKRNDTKMLEKHYIFSALKCTREPLLLQRFLRYILNDTDIPTEELNRAIKDLARTEVHQPIIQKFVVENWSHFFNRTSISADQMFFTGILEDKELWVCTKDYVTEGYHNSPRAVIEPGTPRQSRPQKCLLKGSPDEERSA
ncbi:aminopeptidase Q-like [Elgaria multicarinata webbii]|uniref:aminopeptidase Q-like n=1 Tax=Elgaria multicarinata webbii TaxID=159646 RepID=UPI002FCD42D8